MDGSVISDAVNLGSRLEALTRLYGGTILISGQTLKALNNPEKYHHRYIDRVQVRGRKEITTIYEVFEGDPDDQLAIKSKRKPAFVAALEHYYKQRFTEAAKVFSALSRESTWDMIYLIYIVRCERHIAKGVPRDWKGVELIQAK